LDAELSAFAQGWSDHMAAAGVLSHNPDLASSPGHWTKAGENVGVGADVDTPFNAFVASPHHYANLVDPGFTLIGIGITATATRQARTGADRFQPPDAEPQGIAPPDRSRAHRSAQADPISNRGGYDQVLPLQVDPLQVDPLQVEPDHVEPLQVEPLHVEPDHV